MFTTLIVFQVLLAAGLIAIVLVQRGPGATMGAAFGAGASGTVFGSRGAGNFLTRTTSWLAAGFFGISLALAVLATGVGSQDAESSLAGSVVESEPVQQSESDADVQALDAMIDSLDVADAPRSGDDASDVGGDAEDAGEAPEEPPSSI